MEKRKYINLNIGDQRFNCHIDAVHATNPDADLFTGKIVKNVIEINNFSGIISAISRTIMDLNRPRDNSNAPAIDEFRQAIKEILESKQIIDKDNKLTKNYLQLAIHGMKDSHNIEFAIGTKNGLTCSQEVIDWFVVKLKTITTKYVVNEIFNGDISKSFHRNGNKNSNYQGYGNKFNTIQIEINRNWRENKQKDLIVFFTEVLLEFDKIFNSKM